jgi:small subunit ribosomal protein S17
MVKTLDGVVMSIKMNNAVVVEITRRVPHPKYKKLLKRSKRFAAALNGQKVSVGDAVSITETKPISKTIHFVVSKVQKEAKSYKL